MYDDGPQLDKDEETDVQVFLEGEDVDKDAAWVSHAEIGALNLTGREHTGKGDSGGSRR